MSAALSEWRQRDTLPVYSDDGPSLASVLGVGRDAAYASVARGDIPSIRAGRVLRVPVPALRRLLGDDLNA